MLLQGKLGHKNLAVGVLDPCADCVLPPRTSKTPPVGLAFDHMRVRLGDMRKLNTYLPAIQQSFEDTIEREEEEADPAKAPW